MRFHSFFLSPAGAVTSALGLLLLMPALPVDAAGLFNADFSWQWRLPAAQHVGQSALLDGEYSRTSVTVSAHLLQLSTGLEF